MNPEKMVKDEAKRALSENWITALLSVSLLLLVPIVAVLISSAAYSVLGETKTEELLSIEPLKAVFFVVLNIAAVAAIVLLSPVYTGFTRAYAMIADGKQPEASEIFYFFDDRRRYKEAVAFMSGLLVKCLGILVVCEAAAIAVFVCADGSDILLGLCVTLAIIGLIAAFLWFHRFAFSVMLFSYYDYDGVSASQTGAQVAKTETGKLIRLTVSFILWLLFTFLVIPIFYVYPYMTCAYFVSTKYLIASYREAEAKLTPVTAPEAAPVAELTLEKAPEQSATQAPAVTLEKAPEAPAQEAREKEESGKTEETVSDNETTDKTEAAEEEEGSLAPAETPSTE